MGIRHAPWAASTIALALARDARAQAEPPKTEETQAPVDVVVTGTRTRERGAKAPVRVDVVTRDEAKRRGATNVGEALASQPNVEVNAGSHGDIGGPSAIRIQGFDRERVLILEDGEPVSGDTGGAVDLSSIPVDDIERIELVTGPASALYGSSAIGGVVNIITGPPLLEGASGRARLELRSRPAMFAAANGAYRKGAYWAGVDTTVLHAGSIEREAPPARTILPRVTRTLLGARGGIPIGGQNTLTGRVRWIRDDATGYETQQVPGLDPFLVDLPDRADRVALRVMQHLQPSREHSIDISAGAQLWHNDADKDRRDSPIDERRDRNHDQRAFEITSTLFDGKPVMPTIGARFEAETFDQLLEREVVTPTDRRTETLSEVDPTTLTSAAAYGQLRIAPAEGVVILPGVRAEAYSQYDGAVAPRLAGSYAPSDEWVFRGSAGRGYRAPSAKEYGFVFDHSFYGYKVEGNQDLVPESSWGLQSDVAWTPITGLRLRAAGFANWVSDLIDLRFDRTDGTGVDVYTYLNVGAARTYGGSVDGAWQVTPRFRSELSYAWLGTRDDTTDRPLPGRPDHTVTAAGVMTLPGQVENTTRFRVHSRSYIDDDTFAPGYATLDVRFARAIAWGLGAYLGVVNALDVTKDPLRFGDQRPVQGRTFYIGMTAELPADEDQP
jgi:outer membrane receptor for ferrienterochelin and colicins